MALMSPEAGAPHGTLADSVGADLRVRPGEGNHTGLPLQRNCGAPFGATRKRSSRPRWLVGLSQRGLEGFDFFGDLQVAFLEGDGMAVLADFLGAVLLVDLEE